MYEAFMNYRSNTDRVVQLVIFLLITVVLIWILTIILRFLLNQILRLVTGVTRKIRNGAQERKINHYDAMLVRETDNERRNQIIRKGNELVLQISAREDKAWVRHQFKVLTIIRNILCIALILVAVLVGMKVNPDIMKKVNDIYIVVEKQLMNILRTIQFGKGH